MGATITDGTTTITPDLVLGYTAQQKGRNIVHEILSRPDVDVSLAEAGLRTGTLKLFFLTSADAEAARLLHVQASRFIYTDADEPTVSMSYVLDAGGTLEIAIDEDTMNRWTLAVDFQEVSA